MWEELWGWLRHREDPRLLFSPQDLADLETAVALLDSKGVAHGVIKPLVPFGIAVLAFHDPDNIQVELTAPLGPVV